VETFQLWHAAVEVAEVLTLAQVAEVALLIYLQLLLLQLIATL